MADLSNVPPEVMQIMTHDPPYSEGEKAILQAYAGRPDANPVVVRAFQNLGALPSQISAPTPAPSASSQSRDFGIPGLDIPDNIGGIGLPTADFMMTPPSLTDSSSAFHADLKHQGANDINMDRASSAPSGTFGAPTLDFLSEDAFRGYGEVMGNIPMPSGDFMIGSNGGPNAASASPTNPSGSSSPTSSPSPSSATASSGLDAAFSASDPALSRVPGFGGALPSPGIGGSTTTDWAARRDLEQSILPPDSVFANMPAADWDKFAYLMSNPNLLAGKLYEGTPMTAAMATPSVAAIAELARNGLLQDGQAMNQSLTSDLTQARMVEETINSMRGQNGAEVSPRAVYQEAFRRALNTPIEDMYAGQGEAGDLANQISITNGYLLLAQPFVSQGQQEYFKTKLDRYAQAYAQQYVNGETDVSYPQWLSDHGAQNLLGG